MNNTAQYREFLSLISKLDPIQFLGLCRIMCVQVAIEKEPRQFDNIFNDVITKFPTLGRKQRRDIIKVLKAAN